MNDRILPVEGRTQYLKDRFAELKQTHAKRRIEMEGQPRYNVESPGPNVL